MRVEPLEHAVGRRGDHLDLGGPGERRVGVAALGADHRPPRVHGPAAGEHVGRVDGVEPDQGEHLAGQRHRELDEVGGPAAGQHLDRLRHLERVAGRAAEGHVHLGEQRGGAHAVGRAEADHRLGQRRGRSASSFMKAPVPTFTSSTSALVPSAIFFDMIELAISGIDSTVPVTSRSA